MNNPFLTKSASAYQDMVRKRNEIRSEADKVYNSGWYGDVPPVIYQKAHQDVLDNADVDEDGNVHFPNISDMIKERMKKRYITAAIEESYGNDVVNKADILAHNNAAWKGMGAGLLGGAAGVGLGVAAKSPAVSAIAGLAGLGVSSYLAASRALQKGDDKASAYLESKQNPYFEKAAAKRKNGFTPGEEVASGVLVGLGGSMGSRPIKDYTSKKLIQVDSQTKADASRAGQFGTKQYADVLRKGIKKQNRVAKFGYGSSKALAAAGLAGMVGLAGHGIYRGVTEA